IVPACDGSIVITERGGADFLEQLLYVQDESIKERVKESEAALAVMNAMIAAEQRHREPLR
ncbi:MAG: hypothetical protein HGA26_09945, partial [Chlorobiaceae bacterium]|nr:hypothetical protein [Chlorobiaceae bacterium]